MEQITDIITPAQRQAMADIVATVRKVQGTGQITYEALYNVTLANAQDMTDEVLAVCHELVWTEYEKDNTLGLLRAVLSGLSINHYRRLLDELKDAPTDYLFKHWEADTTDEQLDPVRLERNYASVCERLLGDRVVEKLGPAGYDALEKVIDDFPEGEDDEELPARLARYKTHEITALRALLAD